jgi:hypothetical protein
MGRSSGVPAGRMVAAYALNSVLVLLTAGVVGLCAAPEVLGHGTLWLVPAVLLLLVLFGQPRLISRMAHLTAVVLRRPRVDTGLADGPLRWSIASQVMSWIVGGLHVPLIIAALGGPVGWRSLLMSLGGFALAAAAGMLTLVVPDGAGVREVVLTTALAPVLSLKEAATVAVLSRLCCTAGEVLGSAAALVTAGWMARRRTAPIPGPEKAQTVPSSSV